MERKRIATLTFITICLVFMQMVADAASAQPVDFKVITGRWARIDGDYTLSVRDVTPGGKVSVSYFNPDSIHVAESRLSTKDGRVGLFVVLQDEGYPGCTYTLFYHPEEDVLAGSYYQAAVDRTYDVIFVRKEARVDEYEEPGASSEAETRN
jgi:hypothetical protein